MILYFSGTGNSEYAAKRISREIHDETVDLFKKIRNHDFTELYSEKPWIIVSPAYAWRIPRILNEWLGKTTLAGSKDIYFIMTCGGSIGNAGAYLKELCAGRQMDYRGCLPVIMPENYIAMFSTPAKEEALKIIEHAEATIDKAASFIKSKATFPQHSVTVKDKMSSSIVNRIFYPMFVHAKKFYVKDTCISCGKCETLCPLANIRIVDGKPVWGTDCTHCMACICRCPVEAIEYGKHSSGLPRYTCPKLY